jgi:Fe-S-cluster containining protein
MHPVIPITEIASNANPSVCAPCGGKCCKTMPGTVFPSDLDAQLRPDVLADKVLLMLESGFYSLDWWTGNPFEDRPGTDRAHYLRPSVRGSEGRWVDESWGGTCTFLGKAGCALAEVARPLECRALVPQAEGRCFKPAGWEAGGRRLGAQAWWEFRDTLRMFEDLYWETVEVKAQYADRL